MKCIIFKGEVLGGDNGGQDPIQYSALTNSECHVMMIKRQDFTKIYQELIDQKEKVGELLQKFGLLYLNRTDLNTLNYYTEPIEVIKKYQVIIKQGDHNNRAIYLILEGSFELKQFIDQLANKELTEDCEDGSENNNQNNDKFDCSYENMQAKENNLLKTAKGEKHLMDIRLFQVGADQPIILNLVGDIFGNEDIGKSVNSMSVISLEGKGLIFKIQMTAFRQMIDRKVLKQIRIHGEKRMERIQRRISELNLLSLMKGGSSSQKDVTNVESTGKLSGINVVKDREDIANEVALDEMMEQKSDEEAGYMSVMRYLPFIEEEVKAGYTINNLLEEKNTLDGDDQFLRYWNSNGMRHASEVNHENMRSIEGNKGASAAKSLERKMISMMQAKLPVQKNLLNPKQFFHDFHSFVQTQEILKKNSYRLATFSGNKSHLKGSHPSPKNQGSDQHPLGLRDRIKILEIQKYNEPLITQQKHPLLNYLIVDQKRKEQQRQHTENSRQIEIYDRLPFYSAKRQTTCSPEDSEKSERMLYPFRCRQNIYLRSKKKQDKPWTYSPISTPGPRNVRVKQSTDQGERIKSAFYNIIEGVNSEKRERTSPLKSSSLLDRRSKTASKTIEIDKFNFDKNSTGSLKQKVYLIQSGRNNYQQCYDMLPMEINVNQDDILEPNCKFDQKQKLNDELQCSSKTKRINLKQPFVAKLSPERKLNIGVKSQIQHEERNSPQKIKHIKNNYNEQQFQKCPFVNSFLDVSPLKSLRQAQKSHLLPLYKKKADNSEFRQNNEQINLQTNIQKINIDIKKIN